MHNHCDRHPSLEMKKGHRHIHIIEKEIAGVKVSRHEDALIFNISKEYQLPYQELLTIIAQKLEDLSAWVDENGGLVGHIKGYITDETHSAMVSVTESCCHITRNTNALVKFSLTCIVFGVDKEKMCHKIAQILQLT